jgi:hypothetical protein
VTKNAHSSSGTLSKINAGTGNSIVKVNTTKQHNRNGNYSNSGAHSTGDYGNENGDVEMGIVSIPSKSNSNGGGSGGLNMSSEANGAFEQRLDKNMMWRRRILCILVVVLIAAGVVIGLLLGMR